MAAIRNLNSQHLGAKILARLEQLSSCSEAGPGVTRKFATAEHKSALQLINDWMLEADLEVRRDAAGNLIGRSKAVDPKARALLTGSHQDTVKQGGKFDGALGIILPCICLQSMHEQGVLPPIPIEVIAFGDEEGTRFQTTMLGSRAIAGNFQTSVLNFQDQTGTSLREAMHNFGLAANKISEAAYRAEQVCGFLEVHIEQASELEQQDLPVGIVNAINGNQRFTVEFIGQASHAGTTSMETRRDALAGAAAMVLAVEDYCQTQENLVGVVGQLQVSPGSANVIPGQVSFSIEMRTNDIALQSICENYIQEKTARIATERKLDYHLHKTFQIPGVPCSSWIQTKLDAAIRTCNIRPHTLFSRAAHDATAMSELTDIGVLFVRCKDGLSHHPDEAVSEVDLGIAAQTFNNFILSLEANPDKAN